MQPRFIDVSSDDENEAGDAMDKIKSEPVSWLHRCCYSPAPSILLPVLEGPECLEGQARTRRIALLLSLSCTAS